MYVKNLRIKNFRNFCDPPFTMDLRPFTLILGENNIGKTNLLAVLGVRSMDSCFYLYQSIT